MCLGEGIARSEKQTRFDGHYRALRSGCRTSIHLGNQQPMTEKRERVVIVTGAAQGLGRSMALALARSGVRVLCVDLEECRDRLEETLQTAQGTGAPAYQVASFVADVTKPAECLAAVNAALEKFGRLDGLVNNAAMGMQNIGPVLGKGRKRFFEVAEDAWRAIIDVNINGPFNMARASTPIFIRNGFGRIVNLVTSYSTMQEAGFSPYGPSKAALEAATVIWAKELAGTGVSVNALLPGGPVDTRMIPSSDEIERSALLKPDVVDAPIVWLITEAGDDVSGHRIIAADWPPGVPAVEAARKASTYAGWSHAPTTAVFRRI